MIPDFPKFKPVGIEDLNIVNEYLGSYESRICEHSFINLFIWKEFDRPKFTIINGNLCIYIHPMDESAFFLEPIGNNRKMETFRTCFSITGKISRVSSEFVSSLNGGCYCVKELPEHHDYVYRVSDLAELKGRCYDGKRNHIRRFKEKYLSSGYVSLSRDSMDDVLRLFDEWTLRKQTSPGPRGLPMLAYSAQRLAIVRAFQNFEVLGLAGGGIVNNDELMGLIVGSRMNEETVCVHICYVHPDVSGLSQTILWEACRRTFSKYAYINLEQDLGITGLRKMKRSYHPLRLEEKFQIELC